MSDNELRELIRRWELAAKSSVDIQRLVGPAALATALPLLRELLQLRQVREATS